MDQKNLEYSGPKSLEYNGPRRCEHHELSLYPYEIATALFSFGDVLEIVGNEDDIKIKGCARRYSDERRGIILVDTIGHVEENGNLMKQFLQKIIAEGWGSKESPGDEMWNLGLMLSGMRKLRDVDESHQNGEFHEGFWRYDWYYGPASQFVQIYSDVIDIVNAGMPFPYLLNRNGDLESISFTWNKIDDHVLYPKPRVIFLSPDGEKEYMGSPRYSYPIRLKSEEVLFLRSDGVDNEILRRSPRYHRKCFNLDEVYREDLRKFFRKNRKKSAVEIRDLFISIFGEYFIPTNPSYHDDAAFAIIKKSD